MIKISDKKLIFLCFFTMVALLGYFATESYRSLLQYRVVNDSVAHTQLVILKNAQLLSNIKDAETGQRGYLLTGDGIFLRPYNINKAVSRHQFLEIKKLTSDNKAQQVRIDSISKLVTTRLKLLDSGITLKKSTGVKYKVPVSLLEDGRRLMDTIGGLSAEITKEEQLLLMKRQQLSYDNTVRSQSLFYLSIFITITLFIFLFYYLIRQVNNTKKMQVELYNRNEWFTQTLTSLGDGVVATSADHSITFMNKAAEKLTLHKFEEVAGMPIETVINITNEVSGAPVIVPTRQAIAENRVVELANHTILTRKDGSQFYIDDSAAPVYDINDRLLGAVLIFRDITEKSIAGKKLVQLKDDLEATVNERTKELNNEIVIRRGAEEEKTKLIEHLVETNKSLEQFLYIVSHNFRRPVANILGLLELYEAEQGSMAKNDTLDYLSNEIHHLDIVLKDLGTITTIRKNQSENKEEIVLRPLVEMILDSLEYEINKIDAHVIVNVDINDKIFCIKTYFNSILLNLINNAIKYKHPDRKLVVRIDFTQEAKHDIITVTDNGLGIDLDKYRDKLFGLYKRFHQQIEGKGLGLHISKTQMEMMGGEIKVESVPDIGTSFLLYFPKIL